MPSKNILDQQGHVPQGTVSSDHRSNQLERGKEKDSDSQGHTKEKKTVPREKVLESPSMVVSVILALSQGDGKFETNLLIQGKSYITIKQKFKG